MYRRRTWVVAIAFNLIYPCNLQVVSAQLKNLHNLLSLNVRILLGTYFSLQAWIFVMISGQMWNSIRGPPFAHRNPQTGSMVSVCA